MPHVAALLPVAFALACIALAMLTLMSDDNGDDDHWGPSNGY